MDPIVIDCRCPGKHPDGDRITLRDKLPFEAGMTLLVLMGGDADDMTQVAERGARVASTMVVHGVESWNVVDEKGVSVRPTPKSVREWLGAFDASVVPLINAAYAQYEGAVMRPLAPASSDSPADGLTEPSTSPNPEPSSTPPS